MAQRQVYTNSQENARGLADYLEQHGYVYLGTVPREEVLQTPGTFAVDDSLRAYTSCDRGTGFPVRNSDRRSLTLMDFRSAFDLEQGYPREYGRLYDEEKGYLWYEGCIQNGIPWGPGTMYLEDGTRYKEGIFGAKGLLCGREYYPNGEVRFEGNYELNHSYGPNFPSYGTFYGQDGKKIFQGEFTIRRSGLGFPFVLRPEAFGKVVQPHPAWKHPLY